MPVFANTFLFSFKQARICDYLVILWGAEIARPDNAAPYRKGGHRETGQRGTRLNRSQRVEHPSAHEKIELAERLANELNPVCHDSTAAPVVSACSQPFCRR